MIVLGKELRELGLGRRTPSLRVAFGAVFTGALLAWIGPSIASDGNVVGSGRTIFYTFFGLLTAAVYVVGPLIVIGSVHEGTVRGELELLRLTPLGPGAIVVQKLLARLVHVGACVAVSFPIFALAFAYGGVSDRELTGALLALVASSSIVCALALDVAIRTDRFGAALVRAGGQLVLLHLGLLLYGTTWFGAGFTPMTAFLVTDRALSTGGVLGMLAVSATIVWIYLRRAAVALVPVREPLGVARLARFDTTRVSRARGLPVDRPVAWRATARPLFGDAPVSPHWAIGPIVIVAMAAPLDVYAMVYAIGVGAVVAVVAAREVVTERRDATLAVLLATPLGPRAILAQKLALPLRLIGLAGVLWLAGLLLNGIHPQVGSPWPGRLGVGLVVPLVAMLGVLVVAALIGLLVGAVTRRATHAVVVAAAAVLAWAALPVLAANAVPQAAWLGPGGLVDALAAFNVGGVSRLGSIVGPAIGIALVAAGSVVAVRWVAERALVRDA